MSSEHWVTFYAFHIFRLLTSAAGIKDRYFSLEAWSEWCQDIIKILSGKGYNFGAGGAENGESPAIEVLQYKEKNGYFACKYLKYDSLLYVPFICHKK